MSRGLPRMKFMVLLWLLSSYTVNIQASTHWMVTESGLIQPRDQSPFELMNPNDLLAFLNQDSRWDNLFTIYNDLTKKQEVIDQLWSDIKKQSDVSPISTTNENCIKAGQLSFFDWYAAFFEDGKSKEIPDEEYLLYRPAFGHDTEVPDCKKISSLTFSMFAFEHLQGMIHRENLTSTPELALPELISPIMTVDQFGHWAALCLKKNSSSWLHYNMASLYWRVRGNAPKAVECSRRAVHYAPREYKDVALLSLGSVLHRSKKTEDAIIVLGAAVDHDPQYHINHFILSTAFAVVGEFNNSIKHLNECLKLSPGFDLAIRYRYALLCHTALWQNMDIVRGIIDELREELIAYHNRERHWIKSQLAILKTMKHVKDFDFSKFENNCKKMTELTGLDFKKLKADGDKNAVIQYFFEGPVSICEKFGHRGVYELDTVLSLPRVVNHIDNHANWPDSHVPPELNKKWEEEVAGVLKPISYPELIDYSEAKLAADLELLHAAGTGVDEFKSAAANKEDDFVIDYFDGYVLYPSTMKVNRNVEDFDREHDWPTNKFCKEIAPKFPESIEAIFPVFLPFENKGVRLKALLTDQIGVPANEEHELPWHPPLCPQDKEATLFTQKKPVKQQITNEVWDTGFLRQKLLEYVGEGDAESVKKMQDPEIGHRIYIAMQWNLAPNWIIYTLSSLYWRVRGNNGNALHCLMTASRSVELKYKDIVLTSLASLFLEMGYFDEALQAAEESFRLSLYEPATNFVLAELNMIKKHRNTHMFHLKQVVRVEPNFLNGLARNLLIGWACVLQHLNAMQEVEYAEGDVCTQVEPGLNMVCEKDGTNCHMTNIQCFSSGQRETSTLARMLELKDEDMKAPPTSADQMDDSMFDAFIDNMPLERSAKQAHQQNYDSMTRSVDTALKGCGPRLCRDIKPEELSLKDEDCTFQHLQLGYWLHIINFRQIIAESYSKIPSEITSYSPSHKKIPDCKIPFDPAEDFYLERLSKVDSEGWEPVLSIMHQFADLFEYYDYVTLGTKISKYVDAKPRWWVGLLAAGWWCGAGGRGACAVRCLAAAHALAPPHHAPHALRALAALLHLQSKHKDAKDVAYLSFYTTPKNKMDAFLVGVSHSYLSEYEQAVWMYRYALTFDDKMLPAKACLHATMCLMLFGSKGSPFGFKAKPT